MRFDSVRHVFEMRLACRFCFFQFRRVSKPVSTVSVPPSYAPHMVVFIPAERISGLPYAVFKPRLIASPRLSFASEAVLKFHPAHNKSLKAIPVGRLRFAVKIFVIHKSLVLDALAPVVLCRLSLLLMLHLPTKVLCGSPVSTRLFLVA